MNTYRILNTSGQEIHVPGLNMSDLASVIMEAARYPFAWIDFVR